MRFESCKYVKIHFRPIWEEEGRQKKRGRKKGKGKKEIGLTPKHNPGYGFGEN